MEAVLSSLHSLLCCLLPVAVECSLMSVLFAPPAPPRKRTRPDCVSVAVSRSPTALFAASNHPVQPASHDTVIRNDSVQPSSGAWSSLTAIRPLVVPSTSDWSTRSWWVDRRVLLPSFIFPAQRSAALHSLLSQLRCSIVEEWNDGPVDLCVVDEEDAVRELRASCRTHVPPAATTTSTPPPPPPPLPLSLSPSSSPPLSPAALTLSTTLSHLHRAVRASIPVLSLSSLLSSGGSLLLPTASSLRQSSQPTIVLSSASGSHAPFSRSFSLDGSLPSYPLLWLTAPGHCSPFIQPRRTRGRQQQPHTQQLGAVDKCRQQAEEAARERERERNERHLCEVCGVQFSGAVDAHIAEATHARKQREQNWQPLVQLAQQLNRRGQTFDAAWRQQQPSSTSAALDEARECSSSGSDSSVGGSGVRHTPSGLCVWYSSNPPPASCFAKWYGDDVLFSAPPHLHRTLVRNSDSNSNGKRDTAGRVEHDHCTMQHAEKRTMEATDERLSVVQSTISPQVLHHQPGDMKVEAQAASEHDEVNVITPPPRARLVDMRHPSGQWNQTQPVEQPTTTEPILSVHSPPALSDRDRWHDSGVVNGADRESSVQGKRGKKRAASLDQSKDEQAGRERATPVARRGEPSTSGQSDGGTISSTQHHNNDSGWSASQVSSGVRSREGQSTDRRDIRSLADSNGTAMTERTAHTAASRKHSPLRSRDEASSSSSGSSEQSEACTRRGSAFLSTASRLGGVSLKQQPRRRSSSRLERELVRLAEYDQQWVRVNRELLTTRTRGGCFHAAARQVEEADSRCVDSATDRASTSDSSASFCRSSWLDDCQLRVTRTSLRRSGRSGDELLRDAALLDGTDLSHFMLFRSAVQASKQPDSSPAWNVC